MNVVFYKKNDFPTTKLATRLWTICEDAYEHGSPWSFQQFEADLNQQQSYYVVLEEDQQIIGFVGCNLVLDEAEITNVAVLKNAQGKGFARKLLHELIAQLKEQDTFQVFLEVRCSNTAAQNLYKSEKFRSLGIRKSYYQHPCEDAMIMSAKVRA
ncbi:ribosomal-protein-alanine acetyltransferase [Enterococcus sp. AZ194]|uniref:ribosomal protein S18-alanine N-acetyltransferase n=1 Tax=Enterococcus sp. AZ194 TaxID=2774629 RepID=UPI003F1F8062